jgi:hypothetical protein
MVGDPGWVAVPFLSLGGDYDAGNTSLADLFTSVAPGQLLFPSSTAQFVNYLMTFQPFFPILPALDPFPPILLPTDLDTTIYLQLVSELLGLTPPPVSISNGVTFAFIQDPAGAPLAAPAPSPSAYFGRSLAAGDVNGDGFDDLAVGAPGESVLGFIRAGRIYLFMGAPAFMTFPGGLWPFPYIIEEPVLPGPEPSEPLNSGPEAFAEFGHAVLLADVDGDGRDELIVSARKGDGNAGEPDQGEVYLYRSLDQQILPIPPGPAQVITPAASSITRMNPVVEKAFAQFGYTLAAGDVNGDGVQDLAVGAPFFSGDGVVVGNDAGRAYVFLGPVTGPDPSRIADFALLDTV